MAEARYSISWSPRSEKDLKCLDCHCQQLGEAALAALAAAIVERAQILACFPEIGRALHPIGPDWRQILHRPYRIIYFVEHATRTVHIGRIWHSARAEPTEAEVTPLQP